MRFALVKLRWLELSLQELLKNIGLRTFAESLLNHCCHRGLLHFTHQFKAEKIPLHLRLRIAKPDCVEV